MRVVVSGTGLRPMHVLSIMKEEMPEIEFVGWYDPEPTYFARLGEGVPRFDSIARMLDEAKPDLFFVGSPNVFHLEQIRQGLEAGVRIFTEKPVVVSVEETMALAELLAKYGTDSVMIGWCCAIPGTWRTCAPRWRRGRWEGRIAGGERAYRAVSWRVLHARLAADGGLVGRVHAGEMLPRHRPVQHDHRVAARAGGVVRGAQVLCAAECADVECGKRHHACQAVDLECVDDAFHSDGDIIDYQTAILQYETGASLAFHTNLNVPDEHRGSA